MIAERDQRIIALEASMGSTEKGPAILDEANTAFVSVIASSLMWLAMMHAAMIAHPGIKKVEELNYNTLAVAQALAQVAFLFWMFCIYRHGGSKELLKRCGLWTLAWGVWLCVIANHHTSARLFAYRVIEASLPTNWWLPPAGLHVTESEYAVCWLIFLIVAEINSDFWMSKHVFEWLTKIGDRVKGWLA